LNPEFDAIKKLFTNLEKTDKKWTIPSSNAESNSTPTITVIDPLDRGEEVPNSVAELEQLEEAEKEKGRGRERIKDNKVRIKILISEIAKSSHEKGIRRALAPIMSGLNVGPTFGMFHSGLIVGPCKLIYFKLLTILGLIEWNNVSLLIYIFTNFFFYHIFLFTIK
jgi:hypothetical protein